MHVVNQPVFTHRALRKHKLSQFPIRSYIVIDVLSLMHQNRIYSNFRELTQYPLQCLKLRFYFVHLPGARPQKWCTRPFVCVLLTI